MNIKDILNVLKKCKDPEIGINIVDLGLIYDIKIIKNKIKIKIILTSPFCPLASFIVDDIKNRLEKKFKRNVDVEIVFDKPWSTERMSDYAKKKLGII